MKYLKAIVFVLLLASLPTKAETYLTGGFGQADISYIGDGTWAQQSGWQAEVREKTPAFHLGLGHKFSSWLSGELLYHDLGTYSMFAGFGQSDADYGSTSGRCDCNSMWGYGTADIKGLSVSVLPGFTLGQSWLYMRLGMLRYKASWHESFTNGEAKTRVYTVFPTPNPYGWSPYVGAGVEFNRFRLEWSYFSQIMPKESALKKVNYVNVGYRF